MTEISVSLNVLAAGNNALTDVPFDNTDAARMPLRDLLPNLLARLGRRERASAVLDQHLLLVCRPLLGAEGTLYDLGVRTGDVIVLASPTALEDDARPPGVRFAVMSDTGDVLELSDHVPISALMPALLAFMRREGQMPGLEEPQVLIGRIVSDPDRSIEEVGAQPGYVIGLFQVRLAPSRITLVLASPRGAHAPFRVSYSPALMGRFDRSLTGHPPDIDLSRALPRGKENAVSPRQAEFVEEDGVWSVQTHRDANAPVFVDGQRLLPGQPIALAENNVLSFGSSPTRPDLQLVVRFETD
jgi:hypothetical protein